MISKFFRIWWVPVAAGEGLFDLVPLPPSLVAGISALAECMDCPDLKGAAEDFVQIHFTEVYKLNEFLQLDVAQLTHLLHQDQLTVRAEAQVTRTHTHTRMHGHTPADTYTYRQ